MPPPIEPEERARIVSFLQEHGGNRSQVARVTGYSKSLVGKVAREEGIPSANGHMTKNATEASAAFREIKRMDIIVDILDAGQALLKGCKDSREYKDVVTGLAIGIDKHRLETGEVTDRTESRKGSDLNDLFARSAERAAREWERRIDTSDSPD